jgi:hypothetical protein
MAMNPISNNPHLRQGALDAFAGTQRRDEKAASAENGAVQPARSERLADKAEISDTARRIVALRGALEAGKAAAAAEPDLREEKLAQVRERLASGFYNSVEVQAKVADGVGQVIRGIEEL